MYVVIVSSYIMTTYTFICKRNNIALYNEKYIFMYKKNICCHYTSPCIIRYTLCCITKIYCHYTSSCIIKKNYCHYTTSCIMRNIHRLV